MTKKIGEKTNWWTWVQFVVLAISIPTNVVLWFHNSSLREKIRASDYSDKSWEAISAFDKQIEHINQKTNEELTKILDPNFTNYFGYKEWFADVRRIKSSWHKDANEAVIQLRIKISNYNNVIGVRLQHTDFAIDHVRRVRSPLLRVLDFIDGCISDREKWLYEHQDVNRFSRGPGYALQANRTLKNFRNEFSEELNDSSNALIQNWK